MMIKALVLDATNCIALVKDITMPEPGPKELLIQVKAIALNPVDALYTGHPLGETGRVIGSDFSGIVVALGSSIPNSSNLETGSTVAGFLQGASSKNDRPGAFAEYLVCPWDLVWSINDLTFEQAATISLCALTAAQALYLRLGVPAPFTWSGEQESRDPRVESLVINGATTSVALYAAQLAQAAGNNITLSGTASSKHFPMLLSPPYNYSHLVDYRSAEWAQDILNQRSNIQADAGYDCISEGNTVLETSRTLTQTAKMAVVRSRQGQAWSTPTENLGREPIYGAVWEGLGHSVEYVGMTLPANPDLRAFTVAFYAWLSEGGKIVPNSARVMPGGLEKVAEDGFALLGTGTMGERKVRSEEWMRPVSAEKLVYRLV